MNHAIGLVAVAFGAIDVREANVRAAALGFDHLDATGSAIDALGVRRARGTARSVR